MEVGKPLRVIEVPKPEPILIPFKIPEKLPALVPAQPLRKDKDA